MTDLRIDDFPAYFAAVHGDEPFPWQTRLLAEVAAGAWPRLLDLPTGTGKTAALDVAVFHLALEAGKPAAERRAPRRVVLVVDRRTVVDQGYARARKIKAALDGAERGVLAEVASRLRALGTSGEPLRTAQLRGGMPRDDAWARRPDQPLVAVSTVDQVGSRLLFRGYGVSEAMRPIHAGLLGHDTLILLDEVHLSQPFRETLAAVRDYRGWAAERPPGPWEVVEMSATPGAGARGFELSAEDRAHPVLSRRLAAKKPVTLGEPLRRGVFEEDCARRAVELAEPGRAVGVVVNRVAAAQAVFAEVRRRLGDRAQVFLVTGRMRPLSRDDLDRKLGDAVGSPRKREGAPVVVVSTQCIEAGADFDFDALVTECASLDALRQRFGRLNRRGEITDATAAVVVRAESLGKDVDPIYGEALPKTWAWLGEAARDFGCEALKLPEGARLTELLSSRDRAPVMLPAHLDLWAHTWPPPSPDPDVGLWLHGVDQRPEADVQLVWRADVTEAMLTEAGLEGLLGRLDVCPPVGLEALSVPVHAARAWLWGKPGPEIADVEGRGAAPEEDRRESPPAGRPALLWRGDESKLLSPAALRPGMTLVVPSTYGGLADGCWDPSSEAAVTDLGDRARWVQTRRATLRLHRALLDPGWPEVLPTGEDEADPAERVEAWLEAMGSIAIAEPWQKEVIDALRENKRRRAVVWVERVELSGEAEPGYPALVGKRSTRRDGGDVSTEDDGASHTGIPIALTAHLQGVAAVAGRFAARCGLPEALAADLVLAARWHDAGKVDPRFQRMLHGGSAFRAEMATEPLAKSALVAADRAARRRARERADYPAGARHELASLALLQAAPHLLAAARDPDLVLHLVASHHGHCRPFAPPVPDPRPVELALDTGAGTVAARSDHGLARLDSGVAERFHRLLERYGWFGLAWLEAILRLADHTRSAEEQREHAS